ncbi:MAG: GGDEF domain-containing protein [Methylocystaceae bacterium]|nr:GGDEF domain-containing protein [Methylocystaceae bacterium]
MDSSQIQTVELLKLRVLKVLLVVGTCALVGFWLTETQAGVIGGFDQYALPFLIFFYTLLTLFLFIRPDCRSLVEIICVSVLACYFVIAHWLFFISADTASLDQLSYQQARIVQWYILIFIACFVFFDTRPAIMTSIVFYLALALPEVQFLFSGASSRAGEVNATAIVALISNPVYIVCLWGVSLIKDHANTVQGHANTMAKVALQDALTGVLNRRGLLNVIKELENNARYKNHRCALVLIDVDHFKRINDSEGHDKGDETLVALAEATQHHLRQSDRLARWGGEEFLVIAPDLDMTQAETLAERLRSHLDEDTSDTLKNVTASYGVAIFQIGQPFEQAFKMADEALYQAKAEGRNCVRTFR